MGPGERCYYQHGVPGNHEWLPETPAIEVAPSSAYRSLCDALSMWNPARYELRHTDQKCINRVLNQNGMCSWEMMIAFWNYLTCQMMDGRVVYDWGTPGPYSQATEVCETRCRVQEQNLPCWQPIYPIMQRIPTYTGASI